MKGWAEELNHLRIQLTQKKNQKSFLWPARSYRSGPMVSLRESPTSVPSSLHATTSFSFPLTKGLSSPVFRQLPPLCLSSLGSDVTFPGRPPLTTLYRAYSLSSISLSCFIFLHYHYLVCIYLPFMSLLSRIYASWRQGPSGARKVPNI